MKRTIIIGLLALSGCCSCPVAPAPEPAVCVPSAPTIIERHSDGSWWATINGPASIEDADTGIVTEIPSGSSRTLRVSDEMAVRLERGDAP